MKSTTLGSEPTSEAVQHQHLPARLVGQGGPLPPFGFIDHCALKQPLERTAARGAVSPFEPPHRCRERAIRTFLASAANASHDLPCGNRAHANLPLQLYSLHLFITHHNGHILG